MKQFRVYLKSELGRLSNQGIASEFLNCVPPQVLSACGMKAQVTDLMKSLSSQEQVNRFVDSLSDEQLEALTRSCDEDWRENGVFEKLLGHSVWKEDRVPVDRVDLKLAEGHLDHIFKRCEFQLMRIAADPELWIQKEYVQSKLNTPIYFPTCLGGFKSGRCKLFDGIHRAIKMAKRGENAIPVCFYEAQ